MHRQRTWVSLVPGVLALCALVAAAAAVLLFARVGAMHGSMVRVYAAVGQATGLVGGSEVWLVGEKIGTVRDVSFLAPSVDTTERVLVTLEVLENSLPFIRRGAAVDIHPGGSLIGAPVVSIRQGVPGQTPISAGDTLRMVPGHELERARADFAAATQGVPVVVGNLRLLAAQLQGARGTLGALGISGTERVGAVAGSASRMLTAARSGGGTMGRAMRGRSEASRHAREALARVDSIYTLLADHNTAGPVGRFRRDSTLPEIIVSLRAELATVAQHLEESHGTAGRLQHDAALEAQVARGRRELAALAADVQRNPLRYLVF